MADTSYNAHTETYGGPGYAPDPSSDAPAGFTLPDLFPSWERSLRAQGTADRTIVDYLKDAGRFADWLAAQGMPPDPVNHTREHVEAFIVHELGRVSERTGRQLKAGSVASTYRRLQQLYRWLDEEGEITVNPMAKMSPPKVVPSPVPVVSDEHRKRLLAACDGTEFEDRRDTAIVRLFFDNGVRLGGMAGLQVPDVDWDNQLLRVLLKGGKELAVPFGMRSAQALDRYVRARTRHKYARSPWLWLGLKGRLTDSGIRQMVERRCVEAGIPHIFPHQGRHTTAHNWLSKGGNEGDLMELMGWTSRDMLGRYGKSAAVERAQKAHRKMALGDEF